MAAVQKANAALVATIADSSRIAEQARDGRAKATQELVAYEQDIRRALLSAKACVPETGRR